jgi:hypothetical protein
MRMLRAIAEMIAKEKENCSYLETLGKPDTVPDLCRWFDTFGIAIQQVKDGYEMTNKSNGQIDRDTHYSVEEMIKMADDLYTDRFSFEEQSFGYDKLATSGTCGKCISRFRCRVFGYWGLDHFRSDKTC